MQPENILIEAAKIYNKVWKKRLQGIAPDRLSVWEIEEIEEEAFQEIRRFLKDEEVGDWEYVRVFCECAEILFPREVDSVGKEIPDARAIIAPGIRVESKLVCLRCGRIQ